MRRLLRRAAPPIVARRPGPRVLTSAAAVALVAATTGMRPAPDGTAPTAPVASSAPVPSFHRIITPDLLVVVRSGLTAGQRARLARIPGVHGLVTADGAAIKLDGGKVNALGVNPAQFRSWTPLATAANQRLWTALQQGEFVASTALAERLQLRTGQRYQLAGAGRRALTDGGRASLGISGIDLLVPVTASAGLGLIPRVLALVSAPGDHISALTTAVRRITGKGGAIVSLRPQQQELPVGHAAASGRPANYLQLFQASAARYCPGLSWTVLAAIGQIESGDGANLGPSSAGALGPMQFLPSTWAVWGITGFGEPGPPNIMDPFDAVPAAARMLCADGAGAPAGLRGAIYAYNHATWYVNEVLALAQEYARDYG